MGQFPRGRNSRTKSVVSGPDGSSLKRSYPGHAETCGNRVEFICLGAIFQKTSTLSDAPPDRRAASSPACTRGQCGSRRRSRRRWARWLVIRRSDSVMVPGMAVDPAARGLGIARDLLSRTEDFAGCKTAGSFRSTRRSFSPGPFIFISRREFNSRARPSVRTARSYA